MDRKVLKNIAVIAFCLALAGGMAWAGSQRGMHFPRDGSSTLHWPIFAICGAFSFAVNWIAFIPAYIFQTERYFDLIGSVTYLSMTTGALMLGMGGDPRTTLIAALVSIWAIRLGSFLFLRIRDYGTDGRFDEIKPSFTRFWMAWTLQALWAFVTLAAGLAAMTSEMRIPLGGWALAGSGLWIAGFTLESVADHQKRHFKAEIENEGAFIATGLWSWSQHPNYLGEIVLWTGLALIAFPSLGGWQYATLISPIFVFLLLTRVTGIPLLDARADESWGDDPGYTDYRRNTPVLFPFLKPRTPYQS